MSLKDDNLRFVLLKAIADAAAKELGKLRDDHLSPLLERYDEDGTAQFRVRLPGSDSLVATVSLAVPKDKLEVADEDAWVAWLEANHPAAVDRVVVPGEPEHTITVPATEDHTVTTLDDKKVTAVMKQFKVTKEGVVDTATGSLVDGVRNVAGGKPKSFAVKYEQDGAEQLAGAYRAGDLDAIVDGTSLPAVGQRPVLERRLEVVRVDSMTVDGRPSFRVEQESVVPVAPPVDQAPVAPTSLEEAFGPDARVRYGYEADYEEDGQVCGKCGDQVATLSSAGLCDGCEADLEAEQDAPAREDDCDTDDDFDPGSWGESAPVARSGW